MDIFREFEIANDSHHGAGKGLDNDEARLEQLKVNPVAEITISQLLEDIESK